MGRERPQQDLGCLEALLTPAEEAQAIQDAVATGAAGIILYLQDGDA
jgi:hypothetical protein